MTDLPKLTAVEMQELDDVLWSQYFKAVEASRNKRKRPGRKCRPDCECRKHRRTSLHNERIGESVSKTAQSKIARGIGHMTAGGDHV